MNAPFSELDAALDRWIAVVRLMLKGQRVPEYQSSGELMLFQEINRFLVKEGVQVSPSTAHGLLNYIDSFSDRWGSPADSEACIALRGALADVIERPIDPGRGPATPDDATARYVYLREQMTENFDIPDEVVDLVNALRCDVQSIADAAKVAQEEA